MVQAISALEELEEIQVMFGEELQDSFFYNLLEKITTDRTTKLVLRKAIEVKSLALNALFSTKPLTALTCLNLDECQAL
jgi:hypothetical protein